MYVKCLNQSCDATEIENDDNFCYKCGHWTARGFSFIQKEENVLEILKGEAIKRENNFSLMLCVFIVSLFSFVIISSFRGADLYKPLFYLKRKVISYVYGYNTSIIKTDNVYQKVQVDNYEEAISLITKDLNSQNFKCSHRADTFQYESEIQNIGLIPVVSFCDATDMVAEDILSVVKRIYMLFPNISGALTNISITNAETNREYIARFQPSFQFANANMDTSKYNKVNKTQILLNSYYFLNADIMQNPVSDFVGDGWYVKDANWSSTVAHELGHYISFVALLKQNELLNITFVNKDNEKRIENVLERFNNGSFSLEILTEALTNFNEKYGTNLDFDSFALTISKYADAKDENGNLIADETIAEAVHDYYLHGDSLESSSYEIINILKKYLYGE